MTRAQYDTLKTMQSIEDTTGRYLETGSYDGRVLPGLMTRGWAERMGSDSVSISAKGYRALRDATEIINIDLNA